MVSFTALRELVSDRAERCRGLEGCGGQGEGVLFRGGLNKTLVVEFPILSMFTPDKLANSYHHSHSAPRVLSVFIADRVTKVQSPRGVSDLGTTLMPN